MAKDLGDAEFWLPSEFLDDDFFSEEEKSRVMLTESDEEDYMDGLAKQMARSFLLDEEKDHSALRTGDPKTQVMAGSPQSTLCGHESPNGPSQVSSPPSSPLEKSKEDPWDILYEAADQVLRMRLRNQVNPYSQSYHGHGIMSIPARKPSPPAISVPVKNSYAGYYPTHNTTTLLTQRQIQAAQFYHLRQQQLLKQQQQQLSTAAWLKQNRARTAAGSVYGEGRCGVGVVAGGGDPLGLSASAWPPVQKPNSNPTLPQPNSGMRAVFLSGGGTKRESAGTGVFLPRRIGNPAESRKKPTCSTVLLPARVVQALNLNLDDLGAQPRYNGGFVLDHDALVNRSNALISNQRSNAMQVQAQSQNLGTHDFNLPKEWTY